jgi:hypothetical protein
MPTVITAGAGKAVGEDTAFEVFAKRLADVGAGCVVITLTVKLAGTGQLKPGLKILADGAIQQGLLGVARVIEPGVGAGIRMRASA